MLKHMKSTIGHKFYGIIGLSFLGLIAVALFTTMQMSAGLLSQKQTELTHLSELALDIAKEEHAKARETKHDDKDKERR